MNFIPFRFASPALAALCVLAPALAVHAAAPTVIQYRDVAGTPMAYRGQPALQLQMTAAEQARTGGGGNRPTYAVVPDWFENGTIEVDIAAELNGLGGPDIRGFAGIAFRIGEDGKFDAVYLRAANGSLNVPPPPAPRDARAIQYISHPDFHFSQSRAVAPGIYEKGAAIGVGSWHRLRLEIDGRKLAASVDGTKVLAVNDLRLDRRGRVALWVGDGTRAYFANLKIMPKPGGD